ncbi:MAG: hypothetical protein AVDCRST_MAG55-889 [uncultured Rubrobacteraceae bacterium]|uniref:Uncharacterized protein n=1 Tax=uncultured Rubrobacteraceae bacterium TaxID=349277 RepID=A0A6J4P2F9_9ACTN|nr:MAG: hypothetical protein AVDCRST_MAG55-889 [uncultured Rubrobacteraceae bacterium]
MENPRSHRGEGFHAYFDPTSGQGLVSVLFYWSGRCSWTFS